MPQTHSGRHYFRAAQRDTPCRCGSHWFILTSEREKQGRWECADDRCRTALSKRECQDLTNRSKGVLWE